MTSNFNINICFYHEANLSFFSLTIFGFNIILNYKNTRTLVGLRIKNYTRKNKEFGKTLLIKKKAVYTVNLLKGAIFSVKRHKFRNVRSI